MAASRRSSAEGARLMCTAPAEPSPYFFGSPRDVRDAVKVQSRRAIAMAAEVGLELPIERHRVEDIVQEALNGT